MSKKPAGESYATDGGIPTQVKHLLQGVDKNIHTCKFWTYITSKKGNDAPNVYNII